MVNSQVVTEVVDALKLDIRVESIPSPIPVIEVNPKVVKNGIVKTITRAASGAQQIMYAPSNQDLYIVGATFSMVKDSTCDVATGVVKCTVVINGTTTALIQIPVITLTTQEASITKEFLHPIKVDRGSDITLFANTYTAGVMSRSFEITFFLDEVN